LAQMGQIALYRDHAGRQGEIDRVVLDQEITPEMLNAGGTIYVNFPFSEAQNEQGPVVVNEGTSHTLLPGGRSVVTIAATNLAPAGVDPAQIKVILRHGTKEIELSHGSDFTITPGADGAGIVSFVTPKHVLLGATEIYIERPRAGSFSNPDGTAHSSTEYVRSSAIKIDNKAAYAFAGDAQGVQIIDRAIQSDDEETVDRLVHRIDFGAIA